MNHQTDLTRYEEILREAPSEEPARQYYFIDALKQIISSQGQERGGQAPSCCVVTFGCQMNARDSEKILGTLKAAGYQETDREEDADFVLFNTCTIRENANEHLYGRLGHLKHCKKEHPERIIAICGCMMQEADEVEKVQEKYPYVDLIFGTHNLYSLAELLFRLFMKRQDEHNKKARERRVVELLPEAERIVEELPNARK